MKREKQNFRKHLDHFFDPSRKLSAVDVEPALERLLDRQRDNLDGVFEGLEFSADSIRMKPPIVTTRRLWVAAGAVALVLAVTLSVALWPRSAPALVEGVDAGLYRVVDGNAQPLRINERLEMGETVRSNGGSGGVLVLADGSRVEIRSQSDLSLERADDGVRIHLRTGSVIVNAAKQDTGRHLYVQTKDVMVSVVGTVFLVNAEEDGSRVAVIEGEVRVQEGTTKKKLRPGDQVTTNPKMESLPLKDEVAWSLHAEAHVALLQQATVAPRLPEPQEAFEVESVRPSSPPPAGGGRGGPAGPTGPRTTCSGPFFPFRVQIDPRRFAAYGATLRALVMAAYGKPCSFVSGGPDWMASDRFDIEAVIPEGSESYTVQQFRNGEAPKLQAMLQTLLARRFKLSLHPEMKDVEVYNVVVVKPGKLKPAEGPQDLLAASAARLVPTVHARMTTRVFAELLAALLGRPVIDKTDLPGLFDVHLEWASQPPVPGAAPGLPQPEQSSIFPAIQDQLGLKLEPARALVEVLVIDHVETPSEN